MLKWWRNIKKLAALLLSALCGAALLTACSSPMDNLKQYETPSLSVVSPTEFIYTEPFSFIGSSESQIVRLFDEKKMLGDQLFGKAHVQYRVISQKPVTKQQTISESVSYPGLTEKELDAPKTITVERDGQSIEADLQEVKFESEGIVQAETGRFIHLTSNTNFGYTTSVPAAGGSKSVDYRDEATGQTVHTNLAFQSMETVQDWHWREDVTIPITVTTYDANYYLLGDKKIPKKEESPALSGYENDLLESLSLSPESYRITRYAWDGEPYEKDGELCRNAVAYGERYVIQCQAVFSGDAPLPDVTKETYQGIAAYTATADLPTGEIEYQVEGIVTYKSLEERTFSIPVLVLSVGAAVVIAAALLILLVLAKRRRKENRQV